MSNTCKLCGGRTSDVHDRGCPHRGAKTKKHPETLEHLSLTRNHQWRWERVDDDEGEIGYEVHGPRDSFIRFEGPNSLADCMVFMAAVIK